MAATAAALANISGRPPRRRPSATSPITQATFTRPIAIAGPGVPSRTGSARSQKSIGPGLNTGCPISSDEVEIGPRGGGCVERTSNERTDVIASSPSGNQPTDAAFTVDAITGSDPASPVASTSLLRLTHAAAAVRRPRAPAAFNWATFRAEGEGFEPSVDETAHNGFRDRPVQPAGPPSERPRIAAGRESGRGSVWIRRSVVAARPTRPPPAPPPRPAGGSAA